MTPWTFREKDPAKFQSLRDDMTKFLYTYGVDALFTDNPDQFPAEVEGVTSFFVAFFKTWPLAEGVRS